LGLTGIGIGASLTSSNINISSSSTISSEELNDTNYQLDVVDTNSIILFEASEVEDFEDKCLCAHEPGAHLPMIPDINDLDLNIPPQRTNVVDDFDELKQQHEPVIQADSSKPDAETIFEAFTKNIPYLSFDKYQTRPLHIVHKVHIGYDWNQYDKQLSDIVNLPPYEDIAFKIINKERDYLSTYELQYYSQTGIFQLSFSFRKWKYRKRTFGKWKHHKWKSRQSTSFINFFNCFHYESVSLYVFFCFFCSSVCVVSFS
jgi:hypothetical protein